MYEPTFRRKRNGVPVLSKLEIDYMGEGFVHDFQPEVLEKPGPVDIERFVEFYLGMTIDYQYLSHKGIYLGMTVFHDTDFVPVFFPETNCAEYISAKANTCFIDMQLLDEKQEGRYRFTLGHEGSHCILHTDYYARRREHTQLSAVTCRTGMEKKQNDPKRWSDLETMEWQANRLSAAILMPFRAVNTVVRDNRGGKKKLIASVSKTFRVSREAADYRLIELGYIDNK